MKKIVYLGDSITHAFTQLGNHDNVLNMGVSGDKTIDLVARISSVIREQPDVMFIMIGTNDYLVSNRYWGDYIDIDFRQQYRSVISLICDNIESLELYLVSIPPVILENGFDSKKANCDIDNLNEYISDTAIACNATYLDVNSLLKSDKNLMVDSYTTDGVHLSREGYEVYYNFIKNYL